MDKINTLLLGPHDYKDDVTLSENVEWLYEPDFSELPKRKYFDVVIIGREINEDEFEYLQKNGKAYTFFYIDDFAYEKNGNTGLLFEMKVGKKINESGIIKFLEKEIEDYYPNPYGEKYVPSNLTIVQGFKGKVKWTGFSGVEINGDYGDKLSQIIYWRNNIPIELNQTIEFWLEYEKEGDVEIALEISLYRRGSISSFMKKWTFYEEDLESIVEIENDMGPSSAFVSIQAKGKGRIKIVGLHDRYSRKGKGMFLPGGKRYVTKNREEIFYYFDPGNLKPPLNVYFSGYKTLEGFEAFNLVKSLGHPFLLLSESRLEGGAFYLGDEEFENAIVDIINSSLDKLGFDNNELILSGLSMGTFGALYYGCRLKPNTVIIGKPLTSIGNIANNERINRPGGFPTSLDVLYKNEGSLNAVAREQMNKRFWDAFDDADWSRTRIAASYMLEDDYDGDAYATLQEHLKSAGAKIYGKGIHGRHNDDTSGIVLWFVSQYKKIIKEFEELNSKDEK